MQWQRELKVLPANVWTRRNTPKTLLTCIRASLITKPLSKPTAAISVMTRPCMTACPTSINIPMFIRQISTGHPKNAAKTIFDQNILGGMCARVCPTETLCEEVCVRETAEGKPVKIGMLQRYATDELMNEKKHPFTRAKATGKKIAVVGGGPAGLACAHRLSMHGHDVTIFEARKKARRPQ